MTSMDELRQRVQAAEEFFGKIGEENREYGERLAEMVDTMDARIRDQQAEFESRQADFDRLTHENEELRSMLLSLLLAVEGGGREQIGRTMRDLYARMNSLAGGAGAEPAMSPAPDVTEPREILPPDAGLDDLDHADASDSLFPPTQPESPPVTLPESAPASSESEAVPPLPDVPDLEVAATAEAPPPLDVPMDDTLPGPPAVEADETPPPVPQDPEQKPDEEAPIPELEALAADVAAAAAGELTPPGTEPTEPPPLTAQRSDDDEPLQIDETMRLSPAERDGLRAPPPDAPASADSGSSEGVEVQVGGETARSRPFERIIQRMSMAAQGGDRERSD